MKIKFLITIFLCNINFSLWAGINYNYDIVKAEKLQYEKDKDTATAVAQLAGGAVAIFAQSRQEHAEAPLYVYVIENPSADVLSHLNLTKVPGHDYSIASVIDSETSSIGKGDIILLKKEDLKEAPEIVKIDGKTYQSDEKRFLTVKRAAIAIFQSEATKSYKLLRTLKLAAGIAASTLAGYAAVKYFDDKNFPACAISIMASAIASLVLTGKIANTWWV